MGVSTSGGQLAGKLEAFARGVADEKRPLMATAQFAKNVMTAAAAAKGVSPETAPIRYRQVPGGVLLFGAGKATIVDQGADPHWIAPRGGGGRRSNKTRKGALTKFATGAALASLFGGSAGAGETHVLGGGVKALAGHYVPIVFHPGTKAKAKHFWRAGRARIEVEAPKVYMREQVSLPLKKVFG